MSASAAAIPSSPFDLLKELSNFREPGVERLFLIVAAETFEPVEVLKEKRSKYFANGDTRNSMAMAGTEACFTTVGQGVGRSLFGLVWCRYAWAHYRPSSAAAACEISTHSLTSRGRSDTTSLE